MLFPRLKFKKSLRGGYEIKDVTVTLYRDDGDMDYKRFSDDVWFTKSAVENKN
jgi:hypothetical protein